MDNTNIAFLVCHRGALGDFILTWPSILLLRRSFKGYRFVGLGRPDYMALAVKLGILDEFHDAESAGMIDFFEDGKLPGNLGRPEKGVLWLKDAKRTADLLKQNSGCDFIPLEPFPSEKIHVAKFHLRGILKYLDVKESFEPVSLTPEFHFPAKNTILIHPGSGGPKKNFSPEFYLEAAKFAGERLKADVKFIIGPVELEKGLGRYFPDTRTLTPENSSTLADVLAGASLFIGNDSGVGHLAGFLGVPSIILYKDTDPEIWGVVGRKVSFLKCHGTDPENALARLEIELQMPIITKTR